ncbi:sigma factor G inhibitor Gin [Paenibacillus sp. SYP-B4298]|uniref:sigma factor G inhibitor Gin n=1 Tax=Paenibacillus sp. SYP-B4298 TaxID=2996034 RepID=UPI0022DDF906|nr:sigma factor G inhibitor Gin [Paenibacillus sp. SYP-B4298]
MEEEYRQTCCIVCNQEKDEGIFIMSEFICDACEAEMVRTDVRDAKYPFFIHQLRRIWLQKNA